MSLKNFVILILAAFYLTACGYSLRGKIDLPDNMKKVYLEGGTLRMQSALKKSIEHSSGEIVSTPQSANLILKIVDEKFKIYSTTVSSRGKSRELEIYYFLEYELQDAFGASLAPVQSTEVTDYYFNDQRDIVAKSIEENTIQLEIIDQLARRVVTEARFLLKSKTNRQ